MLEKRFYAPSSAFGNIITCIFDETEWKVVLDMRRRKGFFLGGLLQTYDYHLAAVNTITFVDEGRRFVSTSDDKTIRVWEYGIAVQIKYIADPGMHSIPAVALHPNNQYFIGTSLDNQIVTYSTKDRFRQNRKKTFKVGRHEGCFQGQHPVFHHVSQRTGVIVLLRGSIPRMMNPESDVVGVSTYFCKCIGP